MARNDPDERPAPQASRGVPVPEGVPDPVSDLEVRYLEVAAPLHAWVALRIPGALAGRLDPSDVVQEVWLRALEKRGTFDPDAGPFRPWIFSIAGFVLLEAFRRLARLESAPGAAAASERSVRDIPAAITTVSRRVARDENLRCLVDEARFLDADERRLLIFRGLEGLSYEVIAERLGIEPPAAMKRWQRLRESISGRLRLRGVLVEA